VEVEGLLVRARELSESNPRVSKVARGSNIMYTRGKAEERGVIMEILRRPGEVYSDRYGVEYFLGRIDERHWLDIVVQSGSVRT